MDTQPTPQARRILDCAQVLIAKGGYNGFSYADISAEVGITKASIHHHFPRKEDLVLTLLMHYRKAAQEGMQALAAQDMGALACLDAYTQWWAACIAQETMPICICAMLAAESPALPATVADEVQRHFAALAGWLQEVLERGVAQGELQVPGDVAAQAQAFMATVHGAMISARACRDPRLFAVIAGPLLQQLTVTDPSQVGAFHGA
ncbi:MAG: TetR/AcrR family transcriptional regulator [Burkholderiaceae bacterium]|jgi:TetR/AcrR family transcriptional repressor of nem operon|nr:TetR/AcrR family transcriptional regulator [Burkholderiaceae bacterium]